MISSQDIRNVTFDKTMRGYRSEDVDAFLQQVASDMEQLSAEKAETEQKLYILAQKIEEYRKDEDNLKTALLNAQRMGENVIKEAKQKAESILREAGIKAEDVARASEERKQENELELERIKSEVAQFKNNVLALYKQHIESLTTLPGDEIEEETEEDIQAEDFEQAEQPLAEPVEAVEDTEPEEEATEFSAEVPALEINAVQAEEESVNEPYSELEIGNEESPVSDNTAEIVIEQMDEVENPEEAEKQSAPDQDIFSGFQGIKFSD